MAYPMLPIAVDVMGGDHGSDVVVEGVVEAARSYGISSILVGNEELIGAKLKKLSVQGNPNLQVIHATQYVSMDESPSLSLRGKQDSSVRRAFELVREGKASAVVSTGNTGAIMATGVQTLGVLPGVVRPAIASLIPRAYGLSPLVLLDAGANVDCRAEQLVQFALMGEYYARTAGLATKPRVALLSNGSERTKGNDVIRAAASRLASLESIGFVGYVEGHDLPHDVVDVVVCDGFVGNILLKTIEGSVELVFDSMRSCVEKTLRGKLAMWLARPALLKLCRDVLNPAAFGGAPLLGLNGIGVVCHGSSKARAVANGVRVAMELAKADLVGNMRGVLEEVEGSQDNEPSYGDGLWDNIGKKFEKLPRSKRFSFKRRKE